MKKGVDYPGITVVYFCHDGAGNLLMNLRNANCRDEKERWDCGGGGLELHDTIEDTIRKELSEEYCAEPLGVEFLGYRDVHREHDSAKTHWVALDFKVLVDPKQVKNGEPHKFDEIGWFTKDTLPSPLHSQLPASLEKYGEKIWQI